jgi:serine/threonine protein kinase
LEDSVDGADAHDSTTPAGQRPSPPPPDALESPDPDAVSERIGTMIGRYKLLQQIGEGGFGVVYMAQQQEPVKRRVALKIIKLGMDTKQVVARFEAERQALALMDHPNIAKVLDGGATDKGRPYFVMELVHGIKITEYCDQNHLSTERRLELVIQVCRGIQHAHQKGIIHRDIKPSNVMVTLHDGIPVPKIIDFGIAKATQAELTEQTVFTQYGQFLGTPAYMSPEQAEMSGLDVDTRSDLYSLGVLLYELLTGTTPFETKELLAAGVEQLRRTLREKEPLRPSTRLGTMAAGELTATAQHRCIEGLKLVKLVRGDLDWIVMKCLEKDRTRRYESVSGLVSDLEHYLNQEPVAARPPSKLYGFQKLVRRNKVAFAAASAVTAALILGLGIATWSLVREHTARRRADTEAAKNSEIAELLKAMLKGVGPSKALGRDTKMLQEILDETAKKIGTSLTKEPEVEIELRATLADVYRELGLYEEMESMARQGLQRLQLNGTGDSLAAARALEQIGEALWRLGRLELAESTERQSLIMAQKVMGGRDHPQIARSLGTLGLVLAAGGKLADGEDLERQAAAMWRRLPGDHRAEVAQALSNLGTVLAYESKLAEAEIIQREALGIRKELFGDQHPAVAASLNSLGYALQQEGKFAEAEPVFRETLAMARKILGSEHPQVALALYNLAFSLRELGDLSEAESLFRESLEMRRKLFKNEHPDVAFSMDDLAEVYRLEGRLNEAEILQGEALEMRRKLFKNEHPMVADSLVDMALVLRDQGRLPEAEELQREALAMHRKFLDASHPMVLVDLDELASTLCAEDKAAEAEARARECLAIREKRGLEEWQTFGTRALLGASLLAQGKLSAAESFLLAGCNGLKQQEERIPYNARPRVNEAIQQLVKLYEQSNRPQQARLWRSKLPSAPKPDARTDGTLPARRAL